MAVRVVSRFDHGYRVLPDVTDSDLNRSRPRREGEGFGFNEFPRRTKGPGGGRAFN